MSILYFQMCWTSHIPYIQGPKYMASVITEPDQIVTFAMSYTVILMMRTTTTSRCKQWIAMS